MTGGVQQQEFAMAQSTPSPQYVESRIEDEPILGPVLFLPDGSLRRLSWMERWMFKLHMLDAKQLEARYYRPAAA
jgi:hypothetical protein